MGFPYFLLLSISNLIHVVRAHVLHNINPFKFIILWFNKWYTLGNFPCALKKNVFCYYWVKYFIDVPWVYAIIVLIKYFLFALLTIHSTLWWKWVIEITNCYCKIFCLFLWFSVLALCIWVLYYSVHMFIIAIASWYFECF